MSPPLEVQPAVPQRSTPRRGSGVLESLQYLRAVASLTVVFVHMQPPLERLGVKFHWLQSGAFGVDIFFVLSGFLIVATTWGRENYSAEFLRKRAVRVVPFYWLITTLILVILLVSPQFVKSGQAETWHIVASYLFLPAFHPVLGSIEPLMVPGWTLNYEVFYFVMWSAVLLLPQARRIPAGVGLLVALVIVGRLFESTNAFFLFYTAPIMLEFVFGILLGLWYHDGPALPRGWGWALIVAGFVGLLAQSDLTRVERALWWGIPATAVVGGALVLERTRPVPRIAPFALLGDASYSTYLTHSMILSAVGQALLHVPMPSPAWTGPVYCVVALAAVLAGAILFHKAIERPLSQAMSGKKRRIPQKPRAQSGEA